MRYLLIVGEASGDLHASNLIGALKQSDLHAEFMFMGGDLMATATGVFPLIHYSEVAFMGFGPVLRNYRKIRKAGQRIQQAMRDFKPDVVIPVDYAGFNFRYVLPHAKALGIPIVYYIAPKLWAWKKWRIQKLQKHVDLLLCILPFEKDFFAQYGLNSLYVGNPCVDATALIRQAQKAKELRRQAQIAILSGSRRQELKSNLEIMLHTVAPLASEYRIIVAGAPGLTEEDYTPYLKRYPEIELRFGDTYRIVAESQVALVTSGTATLETGILGTPLIVCYRMGGQRWLRWVWSHFFSVPYISLVNLILNHPAVPELLGSEVNKENISMHLTSLLFGRGRLIQLNSLTELRLRLGHEHSSSKAAQAITNFLTNSENKQNHDTV